MGRMAKEGVVGGKGQENKRACTPLQGDTCGSHSKSRGKCSSFAIVYACPLTGRTGLGPGSPASLSAALPEFLALVRLFAIKETPSPVRLPISSQNFAWRTE